MNATKRITVGDIMTKEPVTLASSDVLDLASDIMNLGRVRHLPVLENDKLVGILSQRDLFHSALVTALGLGPKQGRELLKGLCVREVMSAPVITVAPDGDIKVAARTMLEKKIGCLPVMENERLVGLVTESDILRYVAVQ
jgi:CBS domain-containing membrane protein